MNWRTYFLSSVSVLAVVCLSCCGPETGTLDPEAPKTEIEARLPESNPGRGPSVDKTQYEKELIMLDGLAASFL